MLELTPLTPAHIPLLQKYLRAYPRQSCDYAICNLMTWGKIYGNSFTIWKEHLVIVNPKYDYVMYPVGPGLSAKELRELVDIYREGHPLTQLVLIPEDWQIKTPDITQYFQLREDRDWADYVYLIENLVKLRGKKLAKKKNLISQFIRTYPGYQVIPITSDKKDVIIRFSEKWRRERNMEGIYLNAEFQAIKNTMEMWDEIPVEGIIICYKNRISAFSIFSEQTVDMVTEHFEKFDPEMKGSAQVINWETAKYLQNRYIWLNREQDMGLKGLRQAKSSYMPAYLVKFIFGKPLD